MTAQHPSTEQPPLTSPPNTTILDFITWVLSEHMRLLASLPTPPDVEPQDVLNRSPRDGVSEAVSGGALRLRPHQYLSNEHQISQNPTHIE